MIAGSQAFRVGLIQMSCALDPYENLAKAEWRIREAAGRGAQVVCLQELFRSQYFCREEDAALFALAESVPGPTTEAISRLARELDVAIVAPVFERRGAGVYHNSAAVIDAGGGLLGLYRKMHIPDDPLYYEKFYFTPGDTGFKAWHTRHATIGVLVCWDQWFPEGARLTAMQGAEILFYPTAIGWHASEKAEFGTAQHESWELIQRSHAVANGCYVCAANRIGREIVEHADGTPVSPDGIEFWGQSFVASPDGQIVTRASVDREQVLVVPCDLARVEFSRTHWPFLRDRRVDAYDGLTRRFGDRS